MTSHYVDITLQADPESGDAHLLGALVGNLHRALVRFDAHDIGISFPGYSRRPRSLGRVLRLHGSQVALGNLIAQPWLHGMRDHVKWTAAVPAPQQAVPYLVQRRQFKTSANRLRRRRMRRKDETETQVRAAIPDSVVQRPDLPFVRLHSASTGQPFCLFVEQRASVVGAVSGAFNSYGLSGAATVPWF